ncbi:MAG TPA: hypothetical protein VFR68_08835 [Candidatus Dormibacteraeota bacterium]|nr:hypothetical protein [Candidatus Dormibacteraeota bacterium]
MPAPPKPGRHEMSAGGVVFRQTPTGPQFALIETLDAAIAAIEAWQVAF